MYSITVLHEGLNKFQVVRGHSPWEAQQKAASKKAAWDHQYARLQARESKRQTYEGKRTQREALKEEAAERTAEAEQLIEELRSVARLYEPIGRSERAGHEVKAIKLIVLLIRRQKSPLVPDRYIMVVLVP
jgi:hypothetical protein